MGQVVTHPSKDQPTPTHSDRRSSINVTSSRLRRTGSKAVETVEAAPQQRVSTGIAGASHLLDDSLMQMRHEHRRRHALP